jgi:hypothetical protein
MTEATLDELLDDPLVRLVMTRDRVRPEELRLLIERAARREEPSLQPHLIGRRQHPVNLCCG